MRRTTAVLIAFAILCAPVSMFCSCGGEIPYYHQESSRTETPAEISDPVPAFVIGENGMYDTANDIEYVLLEGVRPKQRGELVASGTAGGKEKRFYEIENEHRTYFLCDEDGAVYKNTLMPMLSMPGDEEFEKQYPGLEAPAGS